MVAYTSTFCTPGCVNLLLTCLHLPAAHLSESMYLLLACLHLPAAHSFESTCCSHVCVFMLHPCLHLLYLLLTCLRLQAAHMYASSNCPHIRVFLLHTCLHLPVAHLVEYTSSFCPPGCVKETAHMSASSCCPLVCIYQPHTSRIYPLPICFACSCRPSVCSLLLHLYLHHPAVHPSASTILPSCHAAYWLPSCHVAC